MGVLDGGTGLSFDTIKHGEIRIYYTQITHCMKNTILLVLLSVGFLLGAQYAFAADLNVICGKDLCTPQMVDEFFSSVSWYPGSTVAKTLRITNDSKKNFPVTVEASSSQATGNLDMVIQFTISDSNGVVLWDGPLHSFYSYGPIKVSNNLGKGKTQTYNFSAYMYESADDQYQGKSTTFNMTIGNYVYVLTTPVPCTAQKPAKPGWFNISKMSSSEVILYWGPIETTPYTGFTVSWGTNRNGTNLGTKNIGKTNEILLTGLALDERLHYFKVRTVNECAVSDYTSILSVGGVPTPTTPEAQATPGLTSTPTQMVSPSPTIPNLLSVTPPPTVTPALIASDGAVLGAATAKSNPADLIPLFVGVSTATLFIYWIYSRLFL